MSADEVDKKWRNMLTTYKRIVDNSKPNKSGRGGKNWEFFGAMDAVVGKSPSTVSLGQLQHTVKSAKKRLILADVAPSQAPAQATSQAGIDSAADELLGPPSDVEPEDVLVDKSAVDMQSSRRSRAKRQASTSMPEWFANFQEEMRKERQEDRRRMQEYMTQQQNFQQARIEAMRESNSLLKLLITQQNRES